MNTAAALPYDLTPGELGRVVGRPLLSPVIEAIAARAVGAAPTEAQRRAMAAISRQPWLRKEDLHELVLMIGRRGGKSSLAALLLVFSAADRRHDLDTIEGGRLHFPGISPRLAQSAELLQNCVNALESFGELLGITYEARADEIEIFGDFTTRRFLTTRAAAEVTTRGLAVPCAVLDEAGHFSLSSGDRTAAAILRALRPAMMQFKHRLLVHSSTPGPPTGAFFDLVENTPPRVVVVRAPTWVSNPRITEQQARESAADEITHLIENAVSRWGWSGESWLDAECVAALPTTKSGVPIPGASYVICVDYASTSDETAICVASCRLDTQGGLRVVVEHLEGHQGDRQNRLSARSVGRRVIELSRKWNGAPCVADQFGAADLGEALIGGGVAFEVAKMDPVHQTARGRTARALVMEGRLSLPDDGGKTRTQLCSLRATEQASGTLSIAAPGNQHDDRADVVLLACTYAQTLSPIADAGALVMTYESEDNGRLGGNIVRKFHRALANGQLASAVPPPGSLEREALIEAGAVGHPFPLELAEEVAARRVESEAQRLADEERLIRRGRW